MAPSATRFQELIRNTPETDRVAFRWGRLCGLQAQPAQAIGTQLERIVTAMEHWSASPLGRAFDALVIDQQPTPVSYVDGQPPFIVIPRLLVMELPEGDLQADLVHEVAHMLLFAERSLFLSEGWAVACGYALSRSTYFPFPLGAEAPTLHHRVAAYPGDGWCVRDYLQGGRLREDLAVHSLPNESNRLAYARAGSFVQHLMAEHGVPRFVGVMRTVAQDPGLTDQDAIERTYERSIEDLERQWRERCGIPLAASGSSAGPSGGSEKETAASAPARRIIPVADPTAWGLMTDQVLRGVPGNSTATLTTDADGFAIEGQMGTKGAFQFVTVSRFLYKDPAAAELVGTTGLRFEARGDGKNYQICIPTMQCWEPGKEFLYLLGTADEWKLYEVPFTHFHRMTKDDAKIVGEQIVGVHFRAFGYRNQPIRLAVRGVAFYV
ncbi:MAG TPA: CIA30 family protein [Polyangia bacterium]|jgi:hypothetical protein|nr:CIA30 family protein [Polyangia bacterium]